MSSAFFRRPGEDSSDSDSTSSSSAEQAEVEELSTRNTENEEPDSNSHDIELATTESLSTNASVAFPETDADSTATHLEQVRTQMLAVLLEDYYKNRAAAFMNAANPGLNYTKDSPDVRPLADKLYAEASKELIKNEILPANALATEQSGQQNSQILPTLDSIVYRSMRDSGVMSTQQLLQIQQGSSTALVRAKSQPLVPSAAINRAASELIPGIGRMGLATPTADMSLSISRNQKAGIYEQNFEQFRLLGKGGFGKVYHAHHKLDLKDYAVKKIPLSPRLTRSYQAGGHDELASILREVQALAKLDHCNIVRYHNTWIEEPKSSPRRSSGQMNPGLQLPRHRLLANQPHSGHPPPTKPEASEGIVFGFDSSRRPSYAGDVANGWSVNDAMHNSTSVRESQIFTDDHVRGSASTDSSLDETVCILHVQMSLYPTTLTQYLSPIPATSSSSPSTPARRHCYHLVPSLRIILGILNGLQYMHAKGLVHRDIKPGNIFLSHADQIATTETFTSSEGFYDVGSCPACPLEHCFPYHVNPRIGDFGLVAELVRSELKLDSPKLASPPSSPSKPVGTEYYRPPQAFDASGQKLNTSVVDEKIDVYALGIILVELLWKCDTSSERLHVLRDLQRGRLPKALIPALESEGHDAGVGEALKGCVKGMIEHDAERRWGCGQVKEAVLGILGRCKLRDGEEHGGSHGAHIGIGVGAGVGVAFGHELGRVTSLRSTEGSEGPVQEMVVAEATSSAQDSEDRGRDERLYKTH